MRQANRQTEKCRAQLAVALARLGRWTEVEPVMAKLRESRTDEAVYLSTAEYIAEAAYGQNQDDLAEAMFRELASCERSPECAARGLSGLAWLKWRQKDGATQSAAEKFAAQLESLGGVKTELRTFDWPTYVAGLQKPIEASELEVFLLGWGPLILDADMGLYGQFHSSVNPPKGLGSAFYDVPEYDKLMDASRMEQNPQEAAGDPKESV
jgi:ABC-type transport system substrate-binding protein